MSNPTKPCPYLKHWRQQSTKRARPSGLGKALEKLNRNEAAVPQFQEAVSRQPDRAEAHYQLGRTFQKLNRTTDSRRELAVFRSFKAEKQESLINAMGSRGDLTRKLGLLSAGAVLEKN